MAPTRKGPRTLPWGSPDLTAKEDTAVSIDWNSNKSDSIIDCWSCCSCRASPAHRLFWCAGSSGLYCHCANVQSMWLQASSAVVEGASRSGCGVLWFVGQQQWGVDDEEILVKTDLNIELYLFQKKSCIDQALVTPEEVTQLQQHNTNFCIYRSDICHL